MHGSQWFVTKEKMTSVFPYKNFGNNYCGELPKKPVRRFSNSLPTANQQITDTLRKNKNCGKHEQLTWYNIL